MRADVLRADGPEAMGCEKRVAGGNQMAEVQLLNVVIQLHGVQKKFRSPRETVRHPETTSVKNKKMNHVGFEPPLRNLMSDFEHRQG